MKARILGFVAALAVGVFSPAKASVVYTYTGDPFTEFGGSTACPSTCSLTGSFTVAQALAANLSYNASVANVTPIAFSFSNGTYSITQSDNPFQAFFSIGTSGTGAITQWVIGIFNTNQSRAWDSDSPDSSNNTFDQTYIGTANDFALNRNSPGTWSVSETPLPAALPLFAGGAGLIGLLARRRKRKGAAAIAA